MKVLGLLFVIAIVVVGCCMFNHLVANPQDVGADLKVFWNIMSSGYKGPFGVDSQKILNNGVNPKYKIGIITDIDLEKNDDGTWYIDNCEMIGDTGVIALRFASPYPQRYNLNVGDLIGFKAQFVSKKRIVPKVSNYIEEYNYFYRSGKVLDHISSQSVGYKIEGIRGLSTPSKIIPVFPTKSDFVKVTGVIMAVETIKNEDPEPDNPSDYLISRVAMKCADGRLYVAGFTGHNKIAEVFPTILKESTSRVLGIPQIPHEYVNLPAHDAIGEGDVVTVTQTFPLVDDTMYFFAYYRSR